MKNVSATKSEKLFDHVFFADLLNFDGPLISLFKGKGGYFYLYCWCEVDASHHRWMIVPIDLEVLRRHIKGLISLREIVEGPPNGELYLVDMDTHGDYDCVYIVDPKQLPPSYVPEADSFFTSEDFDCLSTKDKANVSSLIDSQSPGATCGNWFLPTNLSISQWGQSYTVSDWLNRPSESLSGQFELTLPSVSMEIKAGAFRFDADISVPCSACSPNADDQFDYALAA